LSDFIDRIAISHTRLKQIVSEELACLRREPAEIFVESITVNFFEISDTFCERDVAKFTCVGENWA
jgi:hypothetical protein